MDKIEELKAKRFEYLKKVWELTEGDEYKFVNMFEVGKELCFDHGLTEKIYQYLSGEGLIEAHALGGSIGITHAGIVEMEDALSNPSKPTEHFPAVNIINIHHMENSQIQQGSAGTIQSTTITGEKLKELRLFVEYLKKKSNSLELDQQQKNKLQAQIDTLDAQISTDSNPVIVKESLKSIRSILEGVAANVLSPSVVSKIAQFLVNL